MKSLVMEIRDLKGQCQLLERDLTTAHAKVSKLVIILSCCYVMSCHVMLCYIVVCCHVIWCYVMLYYDASCYDVIYFDAS